jgi:hypothetical protein
MIVMNIWCRYYKNIQLVFREQQLQEDSPHIKSFRKINST